MLEEFRDIKSARQIPLFKGDQWEITVPALLEDEDEGGEGKTDEVADAFEARLSAPGATQGGGGARMGGQAEPAGSSGRSLRLKGLPLSKSVSEDLVNRVQKQMRRLQGHFLVATLAPLRADELPPPSGHEDPITFEVVSSRQTVLHYCMSNALQFNSLRYAQYSTMVLLYEMLHPSKPMQVEKPPLNHPEP